MTLPIMEQAIPLQLPGARHHRSQFVRIAPKIAVL